MAKGLVEDKKFFYEKAVLERVGLNDFIKNYDKAVSFGDKKPRFFANLADFINYLYTLKRTNKIQLIFSARMSLNSNPVNKISVNLSDFIANY